MKMSVIAVFATLITMSSASLSMDNDDIRYIPSGYILAKYTKQESYIRMSNKQKRLAYARFDKRLIEACGKVVTEDSLYKNNRLNVSHKCAPAYFRIINKEANIIDNHREYCLYTKDYLTCKTKIMLDPRKTEDTSKLRIRKPVLDYSLNIR